MVIVTRIGLPQVEQEPVGFRVVTSVCIGAVTGTEGRAGVGAVGAGVGADGAGADGVGGDGAGADGAGADGVGVDGGTGLDCNDESNF